MNHLHAYQNKILLVDGERFAPCIAKAVARPCPSAADVRKAHRKWLERAAALPGEAVQGTGYDEDGERIIFGDAVAHAPLGVMHFGKKNEPAKINMEAYTKACNAAGFRADAPKAIRATKGKVGVIPIYGPVDQRMSSELDKAGGTPLDFVSAALDAMLGNASIGAIVLRFNSPGGSVDSVQELSDKIFAARSQKPIYSMVDSMMASAALWIGTAASMVICTPGGGGSVIGSHGVYVMHIDESMATENEGVKVTTVSAGKYKTEFSPFAPLSEAARVEAQARVDDIYDQFTSALKRNRGTTKEDVLANYGQGRMLTAQKALSVGLADRVMTFDNLMAKLTGGAVEVGSGGTGARAETMMMTPTQTTIKKIELRRDQWRRNS